ncbi:MAG: hypothetical protein JWP52_2275 [Rhizobacter sp.]|jgi:hypothetical protein|nr:hypothetical protein [Rhizobacter sp.]
MNRPTVERSAHSPEKATSISKQTQMTQTYLRLVYALTLAGLSSLVPTAGAQAATCDQTLNPGANVSSAVSSAAAGSTICLNAGSYGSASFGSVTKSSPVNIQSTSDRSASIGLNISGSNGLAFSNLTITSMNLSGSSTKNIAVRSSTFKGQAVLNVSGNSNANILIDGSTFDGISVCSNCSEGRLHITQPGALGSQPVGVTVSNNHFGGAGESDGIQVGAYGVVIGPGNTFDGIIQGSYGRHVDALQLYGQSHTTVIGNFFANGDTFIMAPDGGNTEKFIDNVFKGDNGYFWKIQLGSHANDVFDHNTIIGAVGVSIDAKTGSSSSSNATVTNNILVDSSFKTKNSNGAEACNNCTFSGNVFNTSGNARGTGTIMGTPSFVGGAKPATWDGFKLQAGSPGYQAAPDKSNMGTRVFPGSASATVSPPSNLRVN